MPLFKPEALYTEPEELEDFLLLAASSVMRGRLPIVRLSDAHFRTWESRPVRSILQIASLGLQSSHSVCSCCRGEV